MNVLPEQEQLSVTNTKGNTITDTLPTITDAKGNPLTTLTREQVVVQYLQTVLDELTRTLADPDSKLMLETELPQTLRDVPLAVEALTEHSLYLDGKPASANVVARFKAARDV